MEQQKADVLKTIEDHIERYSVGGFDYIVWLGSINLLSKEARTIQHQSTMSPPGSCWDTAEEAMADGMRYLKSMDMPFQTWYRYKDSWGEYLFYYDLIVIKSTTLRVDTH